MELTVGKLREVFGYEYPTINYALDGRNDDEVINYGDLILRSSYLAVKMWCREDIETVLESMQYEGTEEDVDRVIKKAGLELKHLSEPTESDWLCIEQACKDAGF